MKTCATRYNKFVRLVCWHGRFPFQRLVFTADVLLKFVKDFSMGSDVFFTGSFFRHLPEAVLPLDDVTGQKEASDEVKADEEPNACSTSDQVALERYRLCHCDLYCFDAAVGC